MITLINYHLGNANVVIDALSKKSSSYLAHMIITQCYILEDLKKIKNEVVLHKQTELLRVHLLWLIELRLHEDPPIHKKF